MLTDRQRELEAERRLAVVRVVQRVRECLAPQAPPLEPEVLGRHPLAALIHRVTAREGSAGRAVIEAANAALSARCHRDSSRMREGRLIALQSPLVLPDRETRDAALRPAPVEEAELETALDRHATAIAPVMPGWWPEFVEIAASYTTVTVNGRPAPPRFSGTYSDAAGAIHGTEPADAELYVEILTHEAGHLWLNLLADRDPGFIRNPYTEQVFVSPWRGDARPIHGILHGAYVFTAVIPALVALGTDAAQVRAARLAVEAADAIGQVVAFGSLSPEATEVLCAADARVKSVELAFGTDMLTAAREKHAADKERKVNRLRQVNPGLRVV
jgi:HEXXH motif-containing protein